METQEVWEGVAHAKFSAATADQAWSLLKDYCRIHQLLPGVEACHLVDGVDGVPGCTRHCTGAPVPSDDGGVPVVPWAKERLLSIDPVGRSYSYEVTESNMGFRRYVATVKVEPEDGDGDGDGDGGGGGGGCTMEWSFMADPVEGWSRDGMVSYLQNGLEAMGKRIEEAVK